MSEEITALGTSLLNRVSAGRREAQRDLRRQQQIQGAFKLLEAGVRVGNQVLERRAEEVTNRDDFQTNQALVSRSMIDAARIIDEDTQARSFPGGVVPWLAANKFKQPILDNLNRTMDTTGFLDKDIDNWVTESALKEAAKYEGAWNNAVQAANKISNSGTIEDYNDYVKLNDGVAENVGGLLFNKASNYLTGRTDEDVNSEIVESIKNNRFVNNAKQLNTFTSALQAGVSVAGSKELAYNIPTETGERVANLADYGIRRDIEAPLEIQSLNQVQKTYYRGNREYVIDVLEVTGMRGGIQVKEIQPVTTQTVNANGNTVINATNPNAFETYRQSRGNEDNGFTITSNSSIFSGVSQDFTRAQWEELAEQGQVTINWAEQKNPRTVTLGDYNQKYRMYEIEIFSNEEGLKSSPPIGSFTIKKLLPGEENLGSTSRIARLTSDQIRPVQQALTDAIAKTNIGNGETVASVDLFERFVLGPDNFKQWERDRYDKESLERIKNNYYYQMTDKAFQLAESNPDIDQQEATDLVVAQFLGSMIEGYDGDETVNTRFTTDYANAPNASAIQGIGYIAQMDSSSELANRIAARSTDAYIPIALKAIGEVQNLVRSTDPVLQEKGKNIRDGINENITAFRNMNIPLAAILDRDTQAFITSTLGVVARGQDPVYSFSEIFNALTGGSLPATENAVDSNRPDLNPESYRRQEVEPKNIVTPVVDSVVESLDNMQANTERNRERTNFIATVARRAMDENQLDPQRANQYAAALADDLIRRGEPLELPK